MASKLNYSTALRNAKVNANTTAAGNAAVLVLYSNATAQPAGPDTAVPGSSVVLATWTCASPFAPAASNGILSPTLPANVNGAATGTQAWWRLSTSGGTAIIDGSAGVTSGFDMNLSGTIVSGQPIQILSWNFTDNNFGH